MTRYRWNWQKRAVRASANDYASLYALVDAANLDPNTPAYTSTMEERADMEQWMCTFAFEHILVKGVGA